MHPVAPRRLPNGAALLLLFAASQASAAPAPYQIVPPPAWVERIEVDTTWQPQPDQVSGGVYDLLWERQVRVAGRQPQAYHHSARMIVNDAGLESASQLSLEFDPAYQQLQLHFVRLLRDHRVLDRLAPSRIRVIQREPELESQVIDGTLSAILLLEDVRVGDVVEYAFTLTGANPVFEGHFADAFAVNWGVPVHRTRYRLLWPDRRPLFVSNHRTSTAPRRSVFGGQTELVWESDDPDPLPELASLPHGYNPWSWVQLSEYESWGAVARWGADLFQAPAEPGPATRALLAELQQRSPSTAARVLAALRFVQDEVRYLGIELGTGSHRPALPEVVLKRRFGDCKDKALLFCALARALGVPAQPALVHSRHGKSLDEWHPSPRAFDHAVARIQLDGKVLWLDPTQSQQGGDLEHTSFPGYQRALVLAPDTRSLTDLPNRSLVAPTVTTRETYATQGSFGPVAYEVETRHEGASADHLRRELLQQSREETAQAYLAFYAARHPKIRATAPPQFTDDRAHNSITCLERYSIPDFWIGERKVALYPSTVEDVIPKPRHASAFMPVGIAYPVHVRHHTELLLPEDWDLGSEKVSLGDSIVHLDFESRCVERKLSLNYEYRTSADSVPASIVASHFKTMDQIRSRLAYHVERPLVNVPASAKGRIDFTVLSVLLCFLPVGLLGMLRIVRHRPLVPAEFEAPDATLDGIRGWLVPLGLWLAGTASGQCLGLYAIHSQLTTEAWARITTAGAPGYHGFGGALVIVELLGRLGLLLGGLAVVVLFLRRRRGFPVMYRALVVVQATLLFVLAVLTHFSRGIPAAADSVLEAALWLVPASIWIVYLRISDRAQSTFVR